MAGTTEWNVGIVQAAAMVWGTPLIVDDGTAGGGDILKIMSDSMGTGIPDVIKDDNVGEPMSGATFQGNVSVEGTIELAARYEGMPILTALFMGEDVFAAEDTTLAEHTQIFQNSNTGFFATVVFDREFGSLWEYQSCKVTQIELTHSDGKLMITPTLVANRCERANPLAHDIDPGGALPAIPRAPNDMILFNHLLVAIAEVTGSESALDFVASGGSDIVTLSDFKITLNRNITGDHTSGDDTPTVEGNPIPGAGEIDEPETDGMPEGQIEITFPNHSALVDGFIKDAIDKQTGSIPKVYKLHAKWEGGLLSLATTPPISNKFHAEFAALTVADGPVNASGPGAKTPVTITFDILTPQTLPTGDMTWADIVGQKPCRFRYINQSKLAAEIL